MASVFLPSVSWRRPQRRPPLPPRPPPPPPPPRPACTTPAPEDDDGDEAEPAPPVSVHPPRARAAPCSCRRAATETVRVEECRLTQEVAAMVTVLPGHAGGVVTTQSPVVAPRVAAAAATLLHSLLGSRRRAEALVPPLVEHAIAVASSHTLRGRPGDSRRRRAPCTVAGICDALAHLVTTATPAQLALVRGTAVLGRLAAAPGCVVVAPGDATAWERAALATLEAAAATAWQLHDPHHALALALAPGAQPGALFSAGSSALAFAALRYLRMAADWPGAVAGARLAGEHLTLPVAGGRSGAVVPLLRHHTSRAVVAGAASCAVDAAVLAWLEERRAGAHGSDDPFVRALPDVRTALGGWAPASFAVADGDVAPHAASREWSHWTAAGDTASGQSATRADATPLLPPPTAIAGSDGAWHAVGVAATSRSLFGLPRTVAYAEHDRRLRVRAPLLLRAALAAELAYIRALASGAAGQAELDAVLAVRQADLPPRVAAPELYRLAAETLRLVLAAAGDWRAPVVAAPHRLPLYVGTVAAARAARPDLDASDWYAWLEAAADAEEEAAPLGGRTTLAAVGAPRPATAHWLYVMPGEWPMLWSLLELTGGSAPAAAVAAGRPLPLRPAVADVLLRALGTGTGIAPTTVAEAEARRLAASGRALAAAAVLASGAPPSRPILLRVAAPATTARLLLPRALRDAWMLRLALAPTLPRVLLATAAAAVPSWLLRLAAALRVPLPPPFSPVVAGAPPPPAAASPVARRLAAVVDEYEWTGAVPPALAAPSVTAAEPPDAAVAAALAARRRLLALVVSVPATAVLLSPARLTLLDARRRSAPDVCRRCGGGGGGDGEAASTPAQDVAYLIGAAPATLRLVSAAAAAGISTTVSNDARRTALAMALFLGAPAVFPGLRRWEAVHRLGAAAAAYAAGPDVADALVQRSQWHADEAAAVCEALASLVLLSSGAAAAAHVPPAWSAAITAAAGMAAASGGPPPPPDGSHRWFAVDPLSAAVDVLRLPGHARAALLRDCGAWTEAEALVVATATAVTTPEDWAAAVATLAAQGRREVEAAALAVAAAGASPDTLRRWAAVAAVRAEPLDRVASGLGGGAAPVAPAPAPVLGSAGPWSAREAAVIAVAAGCVPLCRHATLARGSAALATRLEAVRAAAEAVAGTPGVARARACARLLQTHRVVRLAVPAGAVRATLDRVTGAAGDVARGVALMAESPATTLLAVPLGGVWSFHLAAALLEAREALAGGNDDGGGTRAPLHPLITCGLLSGERALAGLAAQTLCLLLFDGPPPPPDAATLGAELLVAALRAGGSDWVRETWQRWMPAAALGIVLPATPRPWKRLAAPRGADTPWALWAGLLWPHAPHALHDGTAWRRLRANDLAPTRQAYLDLLRTAPARLLRDHALRADVRVDLPLLRCPAPRFMGAALDRPTRRCQLQAWRQALAAVEEALAPATTTAAAAGTGLAYARVWRAATAAASMAQTALTATSGAPVAAAGADVATRERQQRWDAAARATAFRRQLARLPRHALSCTTGAPPAALTATPLPLLTAVNLFAAHAEASAYVPCRAEEALPGASPRPGAAAGAALAARVAAMLVDTPAFVQAAVPVPGRWCGGRLWSFVDGLSSSPLSQDGSDEELAAWLATTGRHAAACIERLGAAAAALGAA